MLEEFVKKLIELSILCLKKKKLGGEGGGGEGALYIFVKVFSGSANARNVSF